MFWFLSFESQWFFSIDDYLVCTDREMSIRGFNTVLDPSSPWDCLCYLSLGISLPLKWQWETARLLNWNQFVTLPCHFFGWFKVSAANHKQSLLAEGRWYRWKFQNLTIPLPLDLYQNVGLMMITGDFGSLPNFGVGYLAVLRYWIMKRRAGILAVLSVLVQNHTVSTLRSVAQM